MMKFIQFRIGDVVQMKKVLNRDVSGPTELVSRKEETE